MPEFIERILVFLLNNSFAWLTRDPQGIQGIRRDKEAQVLGANRHTIPVVKLSNPPMCAHSCFLICLTQRPLMLYASLS